jgi:hypothetical protein
MRRWRRWIGGAAAVATVSVILHGCGGFEPLVAQELRIRSVRLTRLDARGVRVDWQTNDPTDGRIDYGPSDSVTTTFYLARTNGVGLDCDGHVMSETRTNCTLIGPSVNTAFDPVLQHQHSLVATEVTGLTTFTLAITARNARGQVAVLTSSLPAATSLLTPDGQPRPVAVEETPLPADALAVHGESHEDHRH